MWSRQSTASCSNAASFEKRGFSHVLDQADLTPATLVSETIKLYHNRGALYDAMAADAAETNGVDKVLEQIYKYART